jgi:hypothetical protein
MITPKAENFSFALIITYQAASSAKSLKAVKLQPKRETFRANICYSQNNDPTLQRAYDASTFNKPK